MVKKKVARKKVARKKLARKKLVKKAVKRKVVRKKVAKRKAATKVVKKRIVEVVIEGLFGLFEHIIPFNSEERITIIHGPNGVGKTTVLRLIKDITSKEHNELTRTPFELLKVTFNDRSILKVRRKITTKKQQYKNREIKKVILEFTYKIHGQKETEPFRPREFYSRKQREFYPHHYKGPPVNRISEFMPFLGRIGPNRWIDHRTDEVLSRKDVDRLYGHILRSRPDSDRVPPKWYSEISHATEVYFIETQRLIDIETGEYKEPELKTMVEKYSENMIEKIQNVLRESGAEASSLDRTFPERVINEEVPQEVRKNNILRRYDEQNNYRKRLMESGLIDEGDQVPLSPSTLDSNSIRVLWHYLNDVDEKFKVFDDLLKRVELFKDIINKRFLYKHFELDKTNGFIFKSRKDEDVPLETLSSGEQHELVLAYELLFQVRENSLIMIDEPELSLHVSWQHKFLDDIKRISDLANLDFLIATHSPSIIHRRRRLMVALEEA